MNLSSAPESRFANVSFLELDRNNTGLTTDYSEGRTGIIGNLFALSNVNGQ